jgi:hypothetical protein
MNMNELNSTYMHLEWFAWVVHPQSPQVKNTESVEATLNGRKEDGSRRYPVYPPECS